jgi:hypothetical protein
MRIIEQLVYKITGDNTGFDKSIDKSEGKVTKFGSVADKIFAGVTVVAIAASIKKLGDLAIATSTALDRVDKMSQKIGISRTAFQEWDFILSQSGASVDGLQMGVKTLSNAAAEAKDGVAEYKDEFDKLGISVTDVDGKMKDQETLFNEVFIALSDMENQTERTAIANRLLGRSATELSPAFNAGGDAIEEMRTQAHELGLVMGDELVDQGVVLTDNIDKLKRAYQGWKNQAIEPILGVMVTLSDKMLGQSSASGNLKTSYNNLKTAVENYNTILDESKGKTDAITQATIAQANAQMQLALQTASEAYSKSNKELDKYNTTIQKSEKWIAKYDKILGDIAEGTGYTTKQLNIMTEQERLTTIAMSKGVEEADRYNITVSARLGYQKDLVEANANLAQAEANQEEFVNLLTQGYVAENEAVGLLLDAYPELEQKVINNVEAYNKEQEAIKNRQNAIALAQKAFTAYDVENEQVLNGIIKMAKGHEDSAYWAELSRLATEKLNEVIIANGAETDKVNKILDNHAQGMESITNYAIALGDSYDENTEKASLLTSTIRALIDSGVDPESEAVADLVAQLKSLGEQTVETGETTTEVVNTNIVPAAQLAFNTWRTEQQRTADEAERQAERTKQAWVDASFGMLSNITSIWSSINKVQSNAHKSELQRMEEEGATEEELQEAKKQFAIEDLKRKKAQGTFQAIIDTASAVVGFLANPGGFAGVGLSAMAVGTGAAQIAAIQSEPLPSFNVGSIRIPDDTQAVVHRNEMILPAPIAEQARQEGVTIAPSGGNTSVPIHLVVELDGRVIGETTVRGINAGQYGRISARVVK